MAETVFHPEAVAEVLEAASWYAQRSLSVARRFVEDVESAVGMIGAAPNRWRIFDGCHRRLVLRRFPYLVIYRTVGEQIWIIAVAHAQRRPSYWRDR